MRTMVKRVLPQFMRSPLRAVLGLSLALPTIPIFVFLFLLRPIKPVKLLLLGEGRIGALAPRTDLFLRRMHLKVGTGKIPLYIAVVGTPCNEQLLKMFERKLRIIRNSYALTLCRQPILRHSGFVEETPIFDDAHYEFNNTKPNLSFSIAEEALGKRLFNEIGMTESSWFVCFHARDSAYLKQTMPYRDWSHHDVRNSDINNYLNAANYIATCGGFAVRMGSVVEKNLPEPRDPRIIDYASHYRTDFGDIYLSGKCKFFVGSSTGPITVSLIFNIPVVCTNTVPIEYLPLRKGDLYIPKKIWSLKDTRFLNFREVLECGAGRFLKASDYLEAGLEVVDNTASEILAVTEEMNERLDGTFQTTEQDELMQKEFRSLFQPHHMCYGSPATIGTQFLRDNSELLG